MEEKKKHNYGMDLSKTISKNCSRNRFVLLLSNFDIEAFECGLTFTDTLNSFNILSNKWMAKYNN